MKKIVKLGMLMIGLIMMFFLINAMDSLRDSNGMGSTSSGSPSPSYQYHLQIFHAF